ncbi:MAG: hypothetical protein Q4C60_02085 [Eubacteriales bacterium]|nr:hypothetical protein [Eubacteriales bacterium]
MPYIREECRAGRTLEICKYHSARYGKPGTRGERRGSSTEAMRAANARKSEKELRRALNANFRDGTDALITLSWRRGKEPAGSREAVREMQLFFRGLGRDYKKAGKVLKYAYTLEIGARGSRHAHAVISSADLQEITGRWKKGAVNVVPLHSGGQYAKIAAYFVKYSIRTEKTEGRKIGRRFYASKNLIRPQARKEIVQARTFSERIRPRAGYYLDGESVRAGICEITGQPYIAYTYIMEQPQGQTEAAAGGRQRKQEGRGRPAGKGKAGRAKHRPEEREEKTKKQNEQRTNKGKIEKMRK